MKRDNNWRCGNTGVFWGSILLIMVLCVTGLAQGVVADLSQQQQEQIKDSVVLVEQKGFSGKRVEKVKKFGTGLVVQCSHDFGGMLYGPSSLFYVITYQHVIEGLKPNDIVLHIHPEGLRNDVEIPIEGIVFQSKQDDLALLAVNKRYLKGQVPSGFQIQSNAPLKPGTGTYYFGFPDSRTFGLVQSHAQKRRVAVTQGDILHSDPHQYLSIKLFGLKPQQVFITAPGASEGSGGGVFDNQGNWIGLLDQGGKILNGKICDAVIRPSVIANFLQKQPSKFIIFKLAGANVWNVKSSSPWSSNVLFDPQRGCSLCKIGGPKCKILILMRTRTRSEVDHMFDTNSPDIDQFASIRTKVIQGRLPSITGEKGISIGDTIKSLRQKSMLFSWSSTIRTWTGPFYYCGPFKINKDWDYLSEYRFNKQGQLDMIFIRIQNPRLMEEDKTIPFSTPFSASLN